MLKITTSQESGDQFIKAEMWTAISVLLKKAR